MMKVEPSTQLEGRDVPQFLEDADAWVVEFDQDESVLRPLSRDDFKDVSLDQLMMIGDYLDIPRGQLRGAIARFNIKKREVN